MIHIAAMNRKLWSLLLLAASLALPQDQTKSILPVRVERRVALLIGNSRYQHQPGIPTAGADVDDMAAALRTLGFRDEDVLIYKDADMPKMTGALAAFRKRIHSNDLAVFYYSGHGGQAGEQNYLLPVEFQSVDDESILPRVAYPMSEIRDLLEGAGARVRLLVFDACRTASLINGKDVRGGLREIGGQPEGTLIAYASAHNQVARFSDGARNSAYTAELLAELRQPGASLKEMLEAAQGRVFRATAGKQTPYLYGFLSGPLYLAGKPGVAARVPAANLCGDGWAMVRESTDAAALRTFVQDFGECGNEVRLAKMRLSTLVAERPTQKTNEKDGLRYVWIPPGSFTMGCSTGDNECLDNEPRRNVTISQGFWMGQTEVTQAAYQRVTGKNPSKFKGPNRPVEQVSWNEAKAYCEATGMRLPKEAEWEYAARAGSTEARYGNLNDIAWYDKNSGKKTHDVAQKQKNAWGLYDMLGNVWEWTDDWYDSEQKYKTLRGGSWNYNSRNSRVSNRGWSVPTGRDDGLGFRCIGE
jgi:formylglycine-generating enzyme required for sulfatase activity